MARTGSVGARLGPSACLASVSAGVLGAVLWSRAADGNGIVESYVADVLVAAVAFALLGAFLTARRPSLSIGWVATAIGASEGAGLLAYGYATWALSRGAVGGPLVSWVALWLWLPGLVLAAVVLPLLFPTGSLLSRRWRWLLKAAAVCAFLLVVPVAAATWTSRGPALLADDLVVPSGWRRSLLDLQDVAWIALPILAAAALVCVGIRVWRGNETTRLQIGVVVAAMAASFALELGDQALGSGSGTWVGLIAVPLPVVAIGVAVLRRGLWDLDTLLNRTLVFVSLSVCIAAVYAVAVTALARLLPDDRIPLPSLLSAAAVAALFHPLQVRLQGGVDRLLYGRRGDPYAVLAGVVSPLEREPDPGAALNGAVAAIAEGLKLPGVRVDVVDGEGVLRTAAAVGSSCAGPWVSVPLRYGGDEVGELQYALRQGSDGVSPRELQLLEDLANHVAVTAKAVQLTGEVHRSRAEIVTAREEERRLLRRELHDRLAAPLTGIAFGIDAARRLQSRDPQGAEQLQADLITQTHESIDVVRDIIGQLRPPVLDERGLVEAIRERARTLLEPAGVAVEVVADQLPDSVSAAVESAVYSIASEAVMNIVKHARARRCSIRLRLADGVLSLTVADDGGGFTGRRAGGLGVQTMTDRAAELGGTTDVRAASGGGTVVEVVLPL